MVKNAKVGDKITDGEGTVWVVARIYPWPKWDDLELISVESGDFGTVRRMKTEEASQRKCVISDLRAVGCQLQYWYVDNNGDEKSQASTGNFELDRYECSSCGREFDEYVEALAHCAAQEVTSAS